MFETSKLLIGTGRNFLNYGNRAPITPYVNDIYKNVSIYSINGWGELTELGEQQAYQLGAYLRKRYDGFLPRKYRKRDLLVLSSDLDRVIMSAEAMLAGFYAPSLPSKGILQGWQPVPVHTIPQEDDNLIYGKAACPRYSQLTNKFLESDEFINFVETNKELINYVVNMSGVIGVEKNFSKILEVQDVLRCQHLYKLQLPNWVNSTVFEKLQSWKALSFSWNVKTDEMKRLQIGPLLGRLVDEMSAKVSLSVLPNGNEEEDIDPLKDLSSYRKMYMYSGHDTTISAILDSLNLFQPPHLPEYASALIIELHKMPEAEEHFVEIFYKNETMGLSHKLDIGRFCGNGSLHMSHCSLENFKNYLKTYIPSDWKSECQLDIQPTSSSPNPLLQSSRKNLTLPLVKTVSNDESEKLTGLENGSIEDKAVMPPTSLLNNTSIDSTNFKLVLASATINTLLTLWILLYALYRYKYSLPQGHDMLQSVYQRLG